MGVPARVVLYILSLSGFLVSFMMRMDITFGLLAMVKNKNITTFASPVYLGIAEDFSFAKGDLEWSSRIQGIIIGSYYWLYVISQPFAGMLTQKFGTKAVFGWAQLTTAIGSLCIPAAARWHYGYLIALRCMQGAVSGLAFPAMFAAVGPWIPVSERGRFMSSFLGLNLGVGLTYLISGFIIEHVGWPYVFFTTGTLGCSWCVAWYFLAFNTPAQHPRISKQELEYIEQNVSQGIQERMKIPWKEIATSLPVWAIAISSFGRLWIWIQFTVAGPRYMRSILGLNIQVNGLLSALPHFIAYLASTVFCSAADYLHKNNVMSLTNIRKTFAAVSQLLPATILFAITFIENNVIATVSLWYVAIPIFTASFVGAMAAIVDVAPNLAGPVLSFCSTIHLSASFLAPIVNGFIVSEEESISQWKTAFGLASGIGFVTFLMFPIFGSAEIQPWNYPKEQSAS